MYLTYHQIRKHRRFDEPLAYTYYIRNKITGQKYNGVRWANIRLGKTPLEDLGVTYFTSGAIAKDFRKNTHNYEYRLCWTFDTIKEARDYERLVNQKTMVKNGWENYHAFPAIQNSEEHYKKLHANNRGSVAWNRGLTWEDFPDEMKQAYIEGMEKRTLSAEGRERLSNASRQRMKKRLSDPAERKKISERASKSKWFNDGVRDYFCHPEKAAHLKPGRITGNLSSSTDAMKKSVSGSKWYNDGEKNYRMKPTDPRAQILNTGRLGK